MFTFEQTRFIYERENQRLGCVLLCFHGQNAKVGTEDCRPYQHRSPLANCVTHLRDRPKGGQNSVRVHLINPSDVSFGTAVITPRWLYVLAAATPESFGDPSLVDETLSAVDPAQIQAGDVVGIGIHTANALRGYTIGEMARARGACVVFGGIHATLYPNEAHELGGAPMRW